MRQANSSSIKRNVKGVKRITSKKFLWKSHMYIIQYEDKTNADKETEGKINSINLEIALETREEEMGVNSHLCIKLFGNPSLKSYKPRTNE
jgi:hypothetical protein